MIDQELRTKIIGVTGIDDVLQNVVYEGSPDLRIWYIRASSKTDRHMDGSAGFTEIDYDIEIHGGDINEVSDTVEALKTGLDGTYGMWGSVHVHGCFIEDHNDDYQYRGIANESLNADEPFNIAAVKLRVFI